MFWKNLLPPFIRVSFVERCRQQYFRSKLCVISTDSCNVLQGNVCAFLYVCAIFLGGTPIRQPWEIICIYSLSHINLPRRTQGQSVNSHYSFSVTIILLLTTILLKLWMSLTVGTFFFYLTSWQCGSIALKDGSVHWPTTVRSCQLEIYSEEVAFRM